MPTVSDDAPIALRDLEAAINHERQRRAQGMGTGVQWAAGLDGLAQVYGQAIAQRWAVVPWAALSAAAQQAWLDWYATTPDTPCIAICSTAQGDAQCKGCGRSFAEVQHWPGMTPQQKRWVWLRLDTQASALRYTRYAQRAISGLL